MTISIGQDVIIRTDGSKIYGKVIGEDSTHVFIKTIIKNKELDTSIKKSKVNQIRYGFSEMTESQLKQLFPLIKIENGFFGMSFYKGNRKITRKELDTTIKPFPSIYAINQKSKANEVIGYLTGFSGGFLIGRAGGRYLLNQKNGFDSTTFLIGCGLSLISIPFNVSYVNNKRKAVFLYNEMISNKKSIGYREDIQISIKGLGVYVDF